MASGKNKKRPSNTAESSQKFSLSDRKTPKSLKSEPKIVKKYSNLNSSQRKEANISTQIQVGYKDEKKTVKEGKRESNNSSNLNSAREKETKITTQVQVRNKDEKKTVKEDKRKSNNSERTNGERNLNSPHTSNVQTIVNQKGKEATERDQKDEGNLGGLIFMCNAKTKPDCFRYHVMGVPTKKQELVMSIKPGLMLFLYDFDLRLMYGIYKASSSGGMKLEPAAFGGAFPAQVRFKVHRNCLPLPERVFKKAIKENYDEKTHKFKTELSAQQVKKLIVLFQPVPLLHSNVQSSVPEPLPVATVPGEGAHREEYYRDHYSRSGAEHHLVSSDHERAQIHKHPISTSGLASSDPLFLSEKEYRSYGLQRQRHILTNPAPSVAPALDPYHPDQEREQLQVKPAAINGDTASDWCEGFQPNPLFLSEREYRTYGLRARRELPSPMTSSAETTIALDKYHGDSFNPYHRDTTSLVERYLSLPRAVAAPSESYSLSARQTYMNDSNYLQGDSINNTGRVALDEAERFYSTQASHVLPDYSQRYHHLGGDTGMKSDSVTSRYSFAGPSTPFY